MCFIGYGQIENDKTNSLIYSKETEKDGIILELFKIPQFKETYKKIELSMTNIYTYHGTTITNESEYKKEFHKKSSITINGKNKFEFTKSGNDWLYNGTSKIGELIIEGFQKREIESTPNKANSNRSHVVIILKLTKNDETQSRIIICDLATNERKFKCENNNIKNLDKNYGESHILSLDKYLCKQEDVPDVYSSQETNSLSTMRETITKEIAEKMAKFNKISSIFQIGGNCDSNNKMDNCSNKLNFWEFHQGNPLNPNWVEEKGKVEKIIKHTLNSWTLYDLFKKYYIKETDTMNLSNINDEDNETFKKIKQESSSNKPYFSLDSYMGKGTLKKFLEVEQVKDKLKAVNISDIKTTEFIDNYDLYKQYICEDTRLKILKHNCELRVHEGYMINRIIR